MAQRHEVLLGLSFGLTTSVITCLGLISGLVAAAGEKFVVIAGVVVIAIANGLADAVSIHTTEEAEIEEERPKHSQREVWLATLFTFLSATGFALTFLVPILLLPLEQSLLGATCWGISLLIVLNFYIARLRGEKPLKLIAEHVSLALAVVLISHWLGSFLRQMLEA